MSRQYKICSNNSMQNHLESHFLSLNLHKEISSIKTRPKTRMMRERGD